jgi:hypothetical protein
VSCRFSQERLASYVEGDLSGAAEECTARHLAACDECRTFLDELRQSQALLKSMRQDAVSSTECVRMRRDVMAIISARQERESWALRVERALVLSVRRRPYALATAALLCAVSVSVVAQIRQAVPGTPSAPRASLSASLSGAVFVGGDTLTRPDGYRDWIMVGSGSGAADHVDASRTGGATRKVYINPPAYQAYARTGELPDGTVMVWEASASLLVSVKDSARFADGWGFFDFTAANGAVPSKAEALPDSSGCRTCHQRDAATDHVFTQLHPVLQSAHRTVHTAAPPRLRVPASDPLA